MELKKVVSTALAGCLMFALVGSASAASLPAENLPDIPVVAAARMGLYQKVFETGPMRVISDNIVVGTGVSIDDNNICQVIIDQPKFTGTVKVTAKIGSRTYRADLNVREGSSGNYTLFENIVIRKGDNISITLWTNHPGNIGGVRCYCWSESYQ